MTTRISSRDWEVLSAYLDGELTPKDRSRLESRLEARADLRAGLDELRRTRVVIRSQPRVRAPRNFTLTPQMVGMRTDRRPALQLFPVMRLTAVLASLLFVFVLLGDFLWSGQSMAVPLPIEESVPLIAQNVGETLSADASEAVVEKVVTEGESAMPMVAEAEQSLDVAAEPAERAPAVEMPAEEAEAYILPTDKAPVAAAPPAPLAGVEPTSVPSVMESIQPEEEIVMADESPEPRLIGAQSTYPERQAIRLIEMFLLIMGLSTGFVAFFLRPKRTL